MGDSGLDAFQFPKPLPLQINLLLKGHQWLAICSRQFSRNNIQSFPLNFSSFLLFSLTQPRQPFGSVNKIPKWSWWDIFPGCALEPAGFSRGPLSWKGSLFLISVPTTPSSFHFICLYPQNSPNWTCSVLPSFD